MMDKKLTTFFKLPPLHIKDIDTQVAATLQGYKNQYPVVDPETLFGIEVEVENVPDGRAYTFGCWTNTDDGSLRNNGREYISYPLRGSYVEGALNELFCGGRSLPKDRKFSPRCSVHVHMNMRDATLEHLYNTVLTYMLFEQPLFTWIGRDRSDNIFCLPIHECGITDSVKQMMEDNIGLYIRRWNKYTAMNLLPLRDKGTIEFRHLYGTDDIEKITNWIRLLSRLKQFGESRTNEQILELLMALNTDSNYMQFAQLVFREDLPLLLDAMPEEELCFNLAMATTQTKYALLKGAGGLHGKPKKQDEVTTDPVLEWTIGDEEEEAVGERIFRNRVRAAAERIDNLGILQEGARIRPAPIGPGEFIQMAAPPPRRNRNR